VNRGYQKGVLRDDQTLRSATAACGPVFYDSDALGAGFRGSAFVCEPAGNVVKRYVFSEKDSAPAGSNPYDNAEFLASTDERFRPVNSLVGPDGALYILDMYRGIIQHKLFVTPYLRAQVLARGLEAPVDRGRIYRIAGEGALRPTAPTRLSRASNSELAALLSHQDLWQRSTAQRLLVERGARDVIPALRAIARAGATDASRLHALWTLDGIDATDPDGVLAALQDRAPAVRAAGLRIAEKLIADPAVADRVTDLTADADRWVRVQAVCSLGELPLPQRLRSLGQVLRAQGADRAVRDAALGGLYDQELSMLRELAQDQSWAAGKTARPVLDDLADCLIRADDRARTDLVEFTASLASDDHPAADALLRRIRAAQRLDSDKPRPIFLTAAPTRWIGAMGERFNSFAPRMAESEVYFDWPDRPPVRRVHGTRPLTRSELARLDRGRTVYSQTCVSCHQGDGRGSSGLAPSLAGSAVAEGPVDRLASVLIHGLEGTWNLGSMTYEAAMPPTTVQDDADLAAVMTFIRRSFGNAADPVTADEVGLARRTHKERNKPWTRTEVDKPLAPPPAPAPPAN
jgi:mono/diheme cytochrome c family protein